MTKLANTDLLLLVLPQLPDLLPRQVHAPAPAALLPRVLPRAPVAAQLPLPAALALLLLRAHDEVFLVLAHGALQHQLLVQLLVHAALHPAPALLAVTGAVRGGLLAGVHLAEGHVIVQLELGVLAEPGLLLDGRGSGQRVGRVLGVGGEQLLDVVRAAGREVGAGAGGSAAAVTHGAALTAQSPSRTNTAGHNPVLAHSHYTMLLC